MVKSNKHIEVVRSTTRGLSCLSKASCDSIVAVLRQHFSTVGVTIINNAADLETLAAGSPDLVFLGMESIPADPAAGKLWLSDFLDERGIAYTGSRQKAHELGRNKPLAKQYLLAAGLRTPAYCVIRQGQLFAERDIPLTFPVFVKPTDGGGGLGIDSESVVHNLDQLRVKAETIATSLQTDTLVEEYLPGREFSVAILKDEASTELLVMPIELIAPPDDRGARLLSSHVKSSNSEQALPVTDETIKAKVTELALDAFYALGARDYGRIDIRLDAAGVPHFLEANLIPSLISGYGSFPKACVANIGLEYEPMILQITQLGLARSHNDADAIVESLTLHETFFLSPQVAAKPI